MDRDGDWRWQDNYKEKSGIYVPYRNHDIESGNLWMEALLGKLVKGSESQKICLKEIKVDILGIRQKF